MQSSPASSSGSNIRAIMGLLLLITGLLIVLVGVSLRSQADDATTTVSIANATPVVADINIGYASQVATGDSALMLMEATTKDMFIFGSYSHANGCSSVNASGTIKLVMYRTGSAATTTSSGLCDAGPNTRYCYDETIGEAYSSSSNIGSTCLGGTDTTADYQFVVKMKFYADPTAANTEFASDTWRFHVYAVDGIGGIGTRSIDRDVADLTALDLLDSSIAFGTLAIGGNAIATSNFDIDRTVPVRNTGNRNTLDIGLSGTAMPCNRSTIPVGNIKYATGVHNASSTYASYPGTLSTSNVSAGFSLGIARGAQGAETVTTNTHWGIQIPLGVSGSCTGTVTFAAQAQP